MRLVSPIGRVNSMLFSAFASMAPEKDRRFMAAGYGMDGRMAMNAYTIIIIMV